MSAPSIPNLLSLRGSRGRGGRGRTPGRGGASSSFSPSSSSSAHDTTIQGTDTDAAVSRMSAVDLGYLDDPYARFFVQAVDGPSPRRLPIINRGTYARTKALDLLIDAFISGDKHGGDGTIPSRQIISLGAGTDTRPFRLFSQQSRQPPRPALIYHEIDFALICQKKLRIVQMNPLLSKILTQATPVQDDTSSTSWSAQPSSSTGNDGDEYYCHGIDLRQLTISWPSTSLPGLRTDIPTLLLSECCLCYLTPSQSSNVLSFFTSRCTTDLALAIYEPIHPDDPFGRQMIANLAARNIRMPTLEVYGTGAAQEARLKDSGLEAVRYMTVEDVWERWIGVEEKERVDGLEGLDEVEEWKLLAGHYVVVWGARGEGLRVWVDCAPS